MPYIMRDKWLNGLMDRGKCHCVNIAVVSSSDHGFSAAYRFDLKTVSTIMVYITGDNAIYCNQCTNL